MHLGGNINSKASFLSSGVVLRCKRFFLFSGGVLCHQLEQTCCVCTNLLSEHNLPVMGSGLSGVHGGFPGKRQQILADVGWGGYRESVANRPRGTCYFVNKIWSHVAFEVMLPVVIQRWCLAWLMDAGVDGHALWWLVLPDLLRGPGRFPPIGTVCWDLLSQCYQSADLISLMPKLYRHWFIFLKVITSFHAVIGVEGSYVRWLEKHSDTNITIAKPTGKRRMACAYDRFSCAVWVKPVRQQAGVPIFRAA